MAEEKRYIDIMIESLQKKEKILDTLIDKCDAQAEVIDNNDYGDVEWSRFNILIVEKEALIEKLNDLDEGFESLYERVGEELKTNKESYSEEIKTMQALIRSVTDKGVGIRTREERNRASLERILTGVKKEIKGTRKSLNTVTNYYNTINGAFATDMVSRIDKKK